MGCDILLLNKCQKLISPEICVMDNYMQISLKHSMNSSRNGNCLSEYMFLESSQAIMFTHHKLRIKGEENSNSDPD